MTILQQNTRFQGDAKLQIQIRTELFAICTEAMVRILDTTCFVYLMTTEGQIEFLQNKRSACLDSKNNEKIRKNSNVIN